MVRYLVRRVGQAGVVVAGVVVLTFAIQRILPGDPAVAAVGPRASAAELDRVRAQLGLDEPLVSQLGQYLRDIVQGDLGTSLRTRRPVLQDLVSAFPASLELVVTGLTIAVLVGIPAGAVAARNRRRPIDLAIRLKSMLAVSLPVFWLALAMQQLFATHLGWVPVAGEYNSNLDETSPLSVYTNITLVDAVLTGNWSIAGSVMSHLLLPAIVLAAYPAGYIAQLTRAALVEEMTQDHARMERSLGFSDSAVMVRFALRPALNPVIALLALIFAYSLANSFLVESVFSWPGIGSYAVASIRASDSPAIAGVTLVVACVYVAANLLVDILQSVIDPRVRLS